VRRLIVNADDFGLTPGVNRAIIEAHAKGVVTSATLMANAAAFDDAVRLTKSSPALSVGCHVVLVDGTPVLSPSQIPTLTDSAEFEARLSRFAARAIGGSINPAEIETEVAAQIRKLQAAGIQLSHVDTHKHSHMFPQVLRPLMRAAKACGLRAIRNPFGQVAFSAVLGRPKLWKRYGELMLLNPLARHFLRSVREEGMLTPDGSLGVAATGSLDEGLFRQTLESLPEGTWEFVTHPGYHDTALDKVRTRLRQSRETELSILTSQGIHETIKRAGIESISYRDLV